MLYFVIAAFVFRFAMLGVSIRNEKALKAAGAREFGTKNSLWLALTHVAFYVAAAWEGLSRGEAFDAVSALGLCIYLFGAVSLVAVVRILGRLWTVKLLIAREHVLIRHRLFRLFRHPNYYLNIVPELIGFALTLHAFGTLVVGGALYAIPLVIRIRQEESVMRQTFPEY